MSAGLKNFFYACFIMWGFSYQANVWAVDSVTVAYELEKHSRLYFQPDLIEVKEQDRTSSFSRQQRASVRDANRLTITVPRLDLKTDALWSIKCFAEEFAATSILVLKKSCIPRACRHHLFLGKNKIA